MLGLGFRSDDCEDIKLHILNKRYRTKLHNSKLFLGTVEKSSRSLMNVPFIVNPNLITNPEQKEALEAKFVKEAKEAGLENLKGHRSVGGMRASIYNAMPKEGVIALVNFMKKFEQENL